MKLPSFIFRIFLFILFFVVCFKTVFAEEYYFNEEFNGGYTNADLWEVDANGGSVVFTESGLVLSSTNGDGFPFIRTKNNIVPEGNYSVEWKMYYTNSNYNYGTGIGLTDVLPNNRINNSMNASNTIFGSWIAANNKVALNSFVCDVNGSNCGGSTYISDMSYLNTQSIYKMERINGRYYLYFEGALIFESGDEDRLVSYLWMGNPIDPQTSLTWSNMFIDYIRVKQLPDKILDVPLYTQVDSRWANDEYDHAYDWTAAYNTEIDGDYVGSFEEWGCAVTSSAMILNYYGNNKLFNGEELNPQTLNNWLKDNNGYVTAYNGGYLDWQSIIRLSKLLNKHYENDPFFHGMILKNDSKASDKEAMKSKIDSEIPLIGRNNTEWSAYGHYVVLKGYDDDEFLINDPMNQQTTILDSKPITIDIAYKGSETAEFVNTIGVYLRSSFPNVSFYLEDKDGNRTGIGSDGQIFEGISNSEFRKNFLPVTKKESLTFIDKLIPNVYAEGDVFIYEIRLSDIDSSKYKVVVESGVETDYELSVRMTNTDATMFVPDNIKGIIPTNGKKEVILNFTDNENNSIEEVQEVDKFDSLIAFVEEGCANGKIKTKGVRKFFLNLILKADKANDDGKIKLAKLNLTHAMVIVRSFSASFFDKVWGKELVEKLKELRDSL